MRFAVGGAWVLALAHVLACGPKPEGQQPSWRRPTTVAGSEARVPAERILELSPDGPAAVHYNGGQSRVAPRFPLADAILEAVGETARELGKETPLPDARLYAAARDLAEVAPADAPLSYSLVEFAMQRHGIIEPSPHLVVIWGPADDPAAILEQLRGRLGEILGGSDFSRVGVGTAARGEGGEVTVLAFQSSFLVTEPIPRALAADGAARIDARIDEPFRDPHLFVTREGGEVEQPPLTRVDGNAFRADLACKGERGQIQVEITAADASGSTVLANFPVWCGVEPPRSVTVDLGGDDNARVASAAEAEERMMALINRDRAAQGLAPLAHDPRLSEVSRAHSRDMHETGLVAHISPRTGSASDRVRAHGIKTSVVLENVARAYGVGEAHEGLMNSPGHRANILAREASHVGVGIVLGDEVSGRREMFVTQVFSHVPGKIDVAKVKKRVGAILRSKRAVGEDSILGSVAQAFADEIAGGAPTGEASARASKRLDGVATHLSRVTTLVTTVADVAAFDPKSALDDARLEFYGVGIAQGDHDLMGEGAIYIVVLLGQK